MNVMILNLPEKYLADTGHQTVSETEKVKSENSLKLFKNI